MSGADTTTASDIFKNYFLDGVAEELNNSCMLLSQIDANEDDVEGDEVVKAHHVGRSSGVGARKEGETLPAAGSQGYAKSNYELYANYGTGRISTRLMKAIETNRGAFVNASKDEMKRIKDDLKREVNFQAWNTSDGVIAALTNTASGNVINLTAASGDRRVFNYLHVGMRVDVGTVANPTLTAADRKITAIDKVTRDITVDGTAFDAATTDRLFRQGGGGAGANQRAITGIQTIVGTGVYAGIDPDDVPEWVSYTKAVGGILTEDLIEETMSEISDTGASVPNLVVTTPQILRKIASDLKADRVFNEPTVLKAGFRGVVIQTPWGDVTLTSDRDCPTGFVFFLNTDELVQFQYADWAFLDEDGSVLHLVSGIASYEFVLEKFHELATLSRRAHGVLTGVTLT